MRKIEDEEYFYRRNDGVWMKNTIIDIQHSHYDRPCGGLTRFGTKPESIRLCLQCATEQGIVW